MAERQPSMYMAWADTSDSKARSADTKALTTSYVTGPSFPIREGQLVQLLAECALTSSTTEASFMLEISHDNETWFPLCAADTPALSGGEMQSDIYPFVLKMPTADTQMRAMSYVAQASFARLSVKGDAAGATLRVRAMV